MRNSKKIVFALMLYCLLPAAGAQTTRQAKTSSQKMSLDLLVSRVDSYWKLLRQGNKAAASAFVVSTHRAGFSDRTFPQFSNPQLKSLELSGDRTEAKVTVNVRRVLPLGITDWPVKDKWVFKDNNWYLQPELNLISMSDGTLPQQSPTIAEQTAAMERELREMVQFEKTALDFGTVRQGESTSLSLKYYLAGNESLRTTIRNSAPGIVIRGLKNQMLTPGQLQELTIYLSTGDYDGAFSERVVLVVHRHEVEVPFEISLQGFVYTPVSIFPRLLEFNSSKGEREKEILVRNNSKSILELKSFRSETGAVAVEPLPVTISAGQQLTMKVKKTRNVPNRDIPERLSIDFAQAIENMASISLDIALTAGNVERDGGKDPTQSPEIQELIQKNKMDLPQR